MKKLVILLIPFILLLSSCRKDDPVQPVNGSPVFYASGTMNSVSFNYQAGVNNYYMTSAFSSDTNFVYDFTGELHDHNCTSSCTNDLKIYIRDHSVHNTSAINIDSALYIGSYAYRMPSTGNTVQFTSQSTIDSTSTYLWNFGDSNTSTLANPTHTYATAGAYNVTLTISGFLGNSSISDSVIVGSTPPMTADFTTTSLNANGDSLQFNATISGGTGPYNYNWDLTVNTGTGNPIVQQFPIDSSFTITLDVSDAATNHFRKKKNVAIPNYTGVLANFDWQSAGASGLDLSMVTVEWTDSNGNVYTSDDPNQPGTSTFQVISVSDYSTNENGYPTKKVHMNINCRLYNGSNIIDLSNADVVFAFAYP